MKTVIFSPYCKNIFQSWRVHYTMQLHFYNTTLLPRLSHQNGITSKVIITRDTDSDLVLQSVQGQHKTSKICFALKCVTPNK
uniref:Uncharacterized protein n=1 Tax=Anguilla anguilla TaxID=7936 RepID=A0A0E9TT08_ANGAN